MTAPSPQHDCSNELQIMFFGHPVERLCTYQYSLITLVPGTFRGCWTLLRQPESV